MVVITNKLALTYDVSCTVVQNNCVIKMQKARKQFKIPFCNVTYLHKI